MTTTITVWADVRCPWCWMGHRRLRSALGRLDRETVVEHRSFLLEPAGPEGAFLTVREAALTSWGMDEREWEAVRSRVATAAGAQGLTIDMDGARSVDSRPVHRLLKYATARGVDAHRAWDDAFAAHLAANDDLTDPVALRRLAAGWGIRGAEVDGLLAGEDLLAEVEADHRAAVVLGIKSIPTFVSGDRALSGHRSEDELVAFLGAGEDVR
ncbi:DsbA family protein [Nocardiopsis dassonvillei]|uniref:DsbA family oxidoreductase n=1 Tax=Nocardiopsis dassonvillei TaxID=2014 RepID=UPI00200D5D22|nr:DsbA family protein [Nocardiopsis dassonvillei]MCK9870754.1 DsbA family protein [Nocardiopsis dassonvillei]